MSLAAAFLLAVSLSMDSFAAALGKGAARRCGVDDALRVGVAFGLCQFATPLVGWAVGVAFAGLLAAVDHWIAFVLLLAVGGAMVRNALSVSEDENLAPCRLGWAALAGAAVATSVDAGVVGVGMAMVEVGIVSVAALIGAVTFFASAGGALLGRIAGPLLGRRAELVGGIGLIGIGIKILVEHQAF